MSCFNPLLAVDLSLDRYSGKVLGTKNGKHIVKILKNDAGFFEYYRERYGKSLMMLPCGHCVACAQDYARTWQARIMCEAEYFEKSCFLTLTYSEAPDVPIKDHLRNFVKSIRNKFGEGIKFFGCGELGSETKRSHYHIILLGVDFSEDRFEIAKRGLNIVYRSPTLEKLWTFGYSSIGSLDISSAGYVSKYCDKKKISQLDEGEFVIMSRGLGRRYFQDHKREIFSSDYLYFNGNKFKIPRYFRKLAGDDSDYYIQLLNDDYAARKREVAASFRYDSLRSTSSEVEGLIHSRDIALDKKHSEEGIRDVF